ncbi:polysaccharide deacetylase family protein [Novipirellula sp. SH528]|uniref:polysaccharide deacetylase family protein n=1 Tax=Novipirellula sp. SH528 TaxID=3454466 RepID=UPI003FA0DD25
MFTPRSNCRRLCAAAKAGLIESCLRVGTRSQFVSIADEPTFTFTFDDAPTTAYRLGAPILEDAGCEGTFFLCGKYIETPSSSFVSKSQALDLVKRGHTLGAHTFSHVNAHRVSPDVFFADALSGKESLSRLLRVGEPVCFSYPFGSITRRVKSFAGNNFHLCRGSFPGINLASIDRAMIRSNRLYSSRFCRERVERLIRKTVRLKGWTVFYSHDVAMTPSPYGVTPSHLRWTIDLCKNLGGRVAVFQDGLKHPL